MEMPDVQLLLQKLFKVTFRIKMHGTYESLRSVEVCTIIKYKMECHQTNYKSVTRKVNMYFHRTFIRTKLRINNSIYSICDCVRGICSEVLNDICNIRVEEGICCGVLGICNEVSFFSNPVQSSFTLQTRGVGTFVS